MAEVKTELLWTMKVIPAPTMMAMYPVTQLKGKGKSENKQKDRMEVSYKIIASVKANRPEVVPVPATSVSQHSLSHSRTEPAGGEPPEAAEMLYLCCSSSITMEGDVLTIKQAAELMRTSTFTPRGKTLNALFLNMHLIATARQGMFLFLSPVFSTFLMTTATCPFSMELSSLTMRMRQLQRTNRDTTSRIRPTARSGRVTSTKRCVPVTDRQTEG